MRLNFTANSFVFGRINRENAARTFYIKHARQKPQKCVWTSQQTASFLDEKIETMRPELFLWPLQGENVQDAPEFHRKLLRFWTHIMTLCPELFSVNLAGRELPKCVWASQRTPSFWTQKSSKCIQNFFIKLARQKLPKWVWTQQQTASFLDT